MPGEEIVEVRELDFELTSLVRGGHGVLGFELGVEDPAVVELVPEIENRPQQIHLAPGVRWLAVLPLAAEILVEKLAIAADRDALLAVDLGGRGADTVAKLLAFRRGRRRLAQLQLLDLPGEDFDLALDLGETLRVRRRGLRSLELRAGLSEELLEPLDPPLESLTRFVRPRLCGPRQGR